MKRHTNPPVEIDRKEKERPKPETLNLYRKQNKKVRSGRVEDCVHASMRGVMMCNEWGCRYMMQYVCRCDKRDQHSHCMLIRRLSSHQSPFSRLEGDVVGWCVDRRAVGVHLHLLAAGLDGHAQADLGLLLVC